MQVERMTTDVNENRFVMIDKKPECLSIYKSPKSFKIKTKIKRFKNNDTKNGKDF